MVINGKAWGEIRSAFGMRSVGSFDYGGRWKSKRNLPGAVGRLDHSWDLTKRGK